MTVGRLRELLEQYKDTPDAVVRCGSDSVERFDYLYAIGFYNDIATLILYFEP